MSDQAQPPVPPYAPIPGQPMAPAQMSDAAKRAAAVTDATTSFFKANMAVGVFALIALGLSLVAGIISTSAGIGASAGTTKAITILHQCGQIFVIVAVGVFFFKRLMPPLNAWVISVTNAAFGGVLSLILNVIFLLALAETFKAAMSRFRVGIDVVTFVLETIIQKPTEILCSFLNTLSLPNVSMIALGAFAVAVIVKSMFLADKR
ncbi:MAG: hypothetical protein AAB215_00305 [Planctomycetota bacterium]